MLSIFALLLCFTMLLGTTLAWFTDSVSNTANKIRAGMLDVDLYARTASGWDEITDSSSPLFESALWEPGRTEYAVLKIVNNGELALKWQATLQHNGTLNALADVIDVYVTEYADLEGEPALPTDADEVMMWDPAGTLAEFIQHFTAKTKGTLKAGEHAYLGIALHMREEADNNYQDLNLGAFDIRILATQHTHESDAFDETYDSDAKLDGEAGEDEEVYYSDLRGALAAIGGDSVIGDGTDQQSAAISVRETANGYAITLLDDVTETAPLTVGKDLLIELNGNTLSFEQTDKGLVIPEGSATRLEINATTEGSGIRIANTGYATAIQVNSGSCTISGGAYSSETTDAGTPAEPNVCIRVDGGELNISNAVVTASDTDSGSVNGVFIAEGAQSSITGSTITATAPNAMDVFGINNKGVAELTDCTVNGYAHYTANAAGTDYATRSMGISNDGTMVLIGCDVVGTHSGVRSLGTLYVDGGTYAGYGHGGFYIAGANTASYLKNATMLDGPMPDGFIDDGVAGTNGAGMYLGGNNNTVYADNCSFSGMYYPVVLRNSSGEVNNSFYVSNSEIERPTTFRGFRIGGSQNAMYIGLGNNFTESDRYVNSKYTGLLEITDVSYKDVVDAAFNNR